MRRRARAWWKAGRSPTCPRRWRSGSATSQARAKDDPRLKCWVLGVPRGVYYPAPFQIFQRDGDLTLVHQFGHQVRTIATNGSVHPEEKGQEFWLGDSRGRWEGDTLVVDVDRLQPRDLARPRRQLPQRGAARGRALALRRRATRSPTRRRSTIPKVYSRPWTIEVLLHRRRDNGFPADRGLLLHARIRAVLSRTGGRTMIARRLPIAALLLAGAAWSHAARRAGARAGAAADRRQAFRWSKTVPVIASGAWNGPRLPDGQPDIAGLLVEHHLQPQQLHRSAGRAAGRALGRRQPAARPARAEPRVRPGRRADPLPARGARAAGGLRAQLRQPDRAAVHRAARALRAGGRAQVVHVARLRDPPVPRLRAAAVRFRQPDHPPRRRARTCPTASSCGTAIRAATGKATRSSSSVRNNNGKALFGRYGDFMSENADGRGALRVRRRRQALQLRRHLHRPDGLHAAVDGDDSGAALHRGRPARRLALRRRSRSTGPGELRYEHRERICVENNGPFGGGAVGVPSDGPVIAR